MVTRRWSGRLVYKQLPPDSVQISNMYRHTSEIMLALTAGVHRAVILLANSSHTDVVPQR